MHTDTLQECLNQIRERPAEGSQKAAIDGFGSAGTAPLPRKKVRVRKDHSAKKPGIVEPLLTNVDENDERD